MQSLLHNMKAWGHPVERIGTSASRTPSAPHIRDANSVQAILYRVVIATIPCWLIGVWNLGHQCNLAMARVSVTEIAGWRGQLVNALGVGHDPGDAADCLFLGLIYFIPVFLIAISAVSIWGALFSAIRQRPLDEGLLVFAWLFSLMLPPGIALHLVALGATFGYLVGSAIFGGFGRYLVNPIVLGLVFLQFSYPALEFGPGNWVALPGDSTQTALQLAAAGGSDAMSQSGYSWWGLFTGNRPGAVGTASVLGCLIGGIYLLLTDTISWRIVLGTVIGMAACLAFVDAMALAPNPMSSVPLSWHLVLGGFAFGVIFLATDPVASATTQTGKWVYGMLVGALTVLIRVSNPSHVDGIVFALLLASLFSPVVDFCVIEVNSRRRRLRITQVPGE